MWTLAVTIATFLLGYIVLPVLGGVGAILIGMVLRPFSKMAAYFVGRYGWFVLETWVYVLAVLWMGQHTSAWMPLPWVVFAYCTFASLNTLYQFDVNCYRSRSGIWYIISADEDSA
jgi:hypothetical protein